MMTATSSPNSAVEPPTKRRRRPPGSSSDRISLDVGGTKSVAAASTLTSSSAYFASLLSDNWMESNGDDEAEVFLDQDPAAFGILLAYMRRGMIKVEDIDTDVLALAEFLGMERLLLAVKVRWYVNIGRGPAPDSDEEIAAAFDEEYGGILKAISSGMFRYFQKRDDNGADRDYAAIRLIGDDPSGIKVLELVNGERLPEVSCGDRLIGALNGLHKKGYTLHEDPIDHNLILGENSCRHSTIFSRRRHSLASRDATDIFIPSDQEMRCALRYTTQFAMYIKDSAEATEEIIAPAEFSTDMEDTNGTTPYAEGRFRSDDDGEEVEFWLERNNFKCREEGIERHTIFNGHIEVLKGEDHPNKIACGIYSRQVSTTRGET